MSLDIFTIRLSRTITTKVPMNKRIAVVFLVLTFLTWLPASGQTNEQASPVATTDTQQKNLQEYIELIRTNVRQQKAQILGAVMDLSASDAAKFWPIYNEYDLELAKINRQRTDNIQEYARNYDQMSDEKADELIKKALDYQKQRSELLSRYYDRVKTSIGAVNAARFLQVETQLLMIIDLQIASNLPLVKRG